MNLNPIYLARWLIRLPKRCRVNAAYVASPPASRGVFYIAFGDRFRAEAEHSAASVKQHNPDLSTALFTDHEPNQRHFDHVKLIEPGHIRAKVDYIDQSPFEQTLYLDSDTEVQRDLTDLFDLLDRFDVAGTHDFARKRIGFAEQMPPYRVIPYAFPEFNGGVLLYRRNERTAEFFKLWRELFYRYKSVTQGWDQASLRMALWQSEVDLHTLPLEYNVRPRANREKAERSAREDGDHRKLEPHILHWHGLEDPEKPRDPSPY